MAPKPDWSTLPSRFLTSIAECLPTQVDVRRYRAVCHSFRSSVALPPEPMYPYPHLSIPASIINDPECDHLRLRLKQIFFYAIGSLSKVSETETKTWVLRVEEWGNGYISVKKPFCGEDYWNLYNRLPETLNLLDYRVKEMGKLYELDFNPDDGIIDEKIQSSRVVVSDDGSCLMGKVSGGGFVVWRNGDEDWTDIDADEDGKFEFVGEDFIYHNDKFYAIYYENVLITVDPKTLDVREIGSIKISYEHRKYLVKSFNDLFLVIKYYKPGYYDRCIGGSDFRIDNGGGEECLFGFRIMKFDEDKKNFVGAKNAFKDSVVFVGDDFAFTVPAKEFLGLKKNSVYLSMCTGADDDLSPMCTGADDDLSLVDDDDMFLDEGPDVHPGLNVGVFDLGKNIALPFSSSSDNVFWPPPIWLKSSSESSRG